MPLNFGAQLGFGAASSVFSSLGSLFNAGAQHRRQKELMAIQQEYNTAAADTAYRRQLEFWNKQNQYNDPSSSRSRLQAAGLNPALMYSGGNSATPSQSLPSVNPASPGGSPQGARASFADPFTQALQMAQIDNIKANTAKTIAETGDQSETLRSQSLANDLRDKQIISTDLANKIDAFDLQFAQDTRQANVDKLSQSVSNLRAQEASLYAGIQTAMDTHARQPEIVAQLRTQTMESAARVGLIEAQAELARAGKALTSAQVEEVYQQIRNLEAANQLAAAQTDEVYSRSGLNQVRTRVEAFAAKYADATNVSEIASNWSSVARDFAIAVASGARAGMRLMR